jgi:pimeloyl-ACP methyl ester carboxylesterase
LIFVLLHGGAHGGWSWERLEACLQARGHAVICPTLPMDDEGADVRRWAHVACERLDGLNCREIVVVGHSAAGLVLPVIATMRPVARMVFVCAVVPLPGRRHIECLGDPPSAITLPPNRLDFDAHGRMIVPWATAREFYYHDCDEIVARVAWMRLCPFAQTIWGDVSPIDVWPDTPSSYVMGKFDRSLSPDYSRRISHDVLDVEPLELKSGHSPMLSCPGDLAAALDSLVRPSSC